MTPFPEHRGDHPAAPVLQEHPRISLVAVHFVLEEPEKLRSAAGVNPGSRHGPDVIMDHQAAVPSHDEPRIGIGAPLPLVGEPGKQGEGAGRELDLLGHGLRGPPEQYSEQQGAHAQGLPE